MKKIGIIPASGIGDALILHTASHHLTRLGHDVVTFSRHLPSFGKWLSGYTFAPLETFKQDAFDCLILQHDNSERARLLARAPLPVYILYGSHNVSKHGPIREMLDYISNPKLTMVENVALAMVQFFGSGGTENGLRPPPGLLFRRYPKRIAIHPTSTSPLKNWPKEKFLKVYAQLKADGFDPFFLTSPIDGTPLFATLEETASFLYESGGFIGNDSGPGHIASAMNLPHIILGPSRAHLELWGPGWHRGTWVTPPAWTSLTRWTRDRWKTFINEKDVIKALKETVL